MRTRLVCLLALLVLVSACSWRIMPTDPNDEPQAPSFGRGGGS